jgi:hypothetical protein
MRYELLPETIARLERYDCPRRNFLRTLDSLKQPGEGTPGSSPEGLRAIKAAHALWGELAKVNAISEEGKQRAIAVMQERLLSLSVDSQS